MHFKQVYKIYFNYNLMVKEDTLYNNLSKWKIMIMITCVSSTSIICNIKKKKISKYYKWFNTTN